MCDVALVHQSELFFSFGIEKAAAMTNASYYERGEERACECLSMFVCLSICACAIHACVLACKRQHPKQRGLEQKTGS